jgi:hypothetical protein
MRSSLKRRRRRMHGVGLKNEDSVTLEKFEA